MPFLKLELEAGHRDPESIEEALFAAGATSVTLLDAGDDPVLEPAPGATPLWPGVRMEALFAGGTRPEAVAAMLSERLGELPALDFSTLEDRPWEREWLKDFRPMRFGQRLWICPGGQQPPPDERATASHPVLLELDPGLAFGTGTHPTTALCLEWLEHADLADCDLLDYGCGSGILAIAALKLGAATASGLDIDPQALAASRDNALRNGVSDRLTLLGPGEVPPGNRDIVLANILAGPLTALAPLLQSLVKPKGRIVLSGILVPQAATVAAAYAPWFDIFPATVRGEWVRLDGVRHPAAAP